MDVPPHIQCFVAPVIGNFLLNKQSNAPTADVLPSSTPKPPKCVCCAGAWCDSGARDAAGWSPLFNANKAIIGAACGVAVDVTDPLHALLIADPQHFVVKRAVNGTLRVIAGKPGEKGYIDGTAQVARFTDPCGLCCGTDGRVFIADTGNHAVRVLSCDGAVTTLAGGLGQGYKDGSGRSASFSELCDIHFMLAAPHLDDRCEDGPLAEPGGAVFACFLWYLYPCLSCSVRGNVVQMTGCRVSLLRTQETTASVV
jgi:hypothetical protein